MTDIFENEPDMTPTENTENTPTTEINSGEPSTDSWYTGEEYTDLASRFDSPDAALKELANAQSLIGKKGNPVPGEDATPEDWANYYNANGRPEDPNEYDLGEPPEEGTWQEVADEKFRTLAHDSGLSQKQASDLYNAYITTEQEAFQQQIEAKREQNEQCLATLKEEYGQDTDRMIGLAVQVAQEYGLQDELKGSDIANSPKLVTMLADYAKLKGTASNPDFDPKRGSSGGTIDEQISALRNSDAYQRYGTPEFEKVDAQILKLYERKVSKMAG